MNDDNYFETTTPLDPLPTYEAYEYSVEGPRSQRFVTWFTLFMCSLINLGSAVETFDPNVPVDDKTLSSQRWTVSCSIITFLASAVVILLHLSPIYSIVIVGTKLEGGIILISCIFWSSVVAIVSDSATGLSVDRLGAISYGNLYYFTWAAFFASCLLLSSYIKSVFYIDIMEEMQARGARISVWACMVFFSLVMTGSSASIFDNTCSSAAPDEDNYLKGELFCNRTIIAIVLGILGACFSLAVIGAKLALSSNTRGLAYFESTSACMLFFSFSFGVAFITSKKGPGAPLGNLYYSTWACFLCTFYVGSSCFEEYHNNKWKRTTDANYDHEHDHMMMDNIDNTEIL